MSSRRSHDVTTGKRSQTKITPGQGPGPASPAVTRPLVRWLHMVLTVVLLAGAVAFGGLFAVGKLTFGAPAPAGGGEGAEGKAKPRVGRYQVEYLEDASRALSGAGDVAFFGRRSPQAWVFRYSGGYLQCAATFRLGDEKYELGRGRDEWKAFFADAGPPPAPAPAKQGYLVLAGFPHVPATDAIDGYVTHLGGIFASLPPAPAGRFHLLPYLHIDARHVAEYRLLMSIEDPRPVPGSKGWNLSTERMFPIAERLVLPSPLLWPADEPPGGGKNQSVGEEVNLLDLRLGPNRLTLKAHFLTEDELAPHRR
jgi:hypothetical protein